MVLMRTVMRAGLVALQMAWGPGAALAAQALPVSRDPGTQIDEGGAKFILGDATKRLQNDDGGDVACNVTLTLQGSLHTFATSYHVDSREKFEEVCDEQGQINVVSSLTWCDDLPHPNAVGCSTRPGSCIVVRPPAGLSASALWAHEYGHNLGLCDVSDDTRIMKQSLAQTNNVVTSAECDAFKLVATGPQTCPQLDAAPDLTGFIRQHYFHGTPYAEARKYRGEVSTLLGYLRNPEYAEYWSNVVLTLGIIADAKARKPLVEFIEARKTPLSRSEMIDKQSAVVALGYLYRGKADRKILRYLERGLEAGEWRKRLAMPVAKDASDSLLLDRQLAIASLQALGITGSKRAAATLDAFIAKKPDQEIEAVARDAVQLNTKVLASGDSVFTQPRRR